MFKLIAATLAALYAVLLIFGDESRRVDVEVTQSATDNISLMSLAAFAETEEITVQRLDRSGLSEAEAVAMALEAGRAYRADRKRAPLRGTLVARVETETPVATDADTALQDLWEVTGSRVNLRSGPSTSDSVVGQLTLGTEAEVLDEGDGWYRIRTVDGSSSGWIYGTYLSRKG